MSVFSQTAHTLCAMPADSPPRFSRKSLAVQALGHIDTPSGALIPPIHLSTTYLRDPDNQYRSGNCYGRPDNPTVRAAEAIIAMLEGASSAMLFGSGMSAATALFLSLGSGAHVIIPKVLYWGLRAWLATDATELGLAVEEVDASRPEAIAAALRPGATRLVWLETPANPLWTITDIAATAALAHAAGALVAVDSTAATPVFTRPLALGADLVMHAATKYLNGHSDVIAGCLVTAREDDLWARIRRTRTMLGQILGPLETHLLIRGMRTLDLRVRAAAANAMELAERLAAHPHVAAVLYPGLPAHPGHAIAARQMEGGFGAMLSIRVRAGEAAAIATAARTRLWKRATSLGGVESLIEHRASIEGAGSPCPPDLLRLSVGIEDLEDLYTDINQALSSA
ncbi:MAG: trans-sulfuration enzyme family protein [Acetobacteraceae bacterium]